MFGCSYRPEYRQVKVSSGGASVSMNFDEIRDLLDMTEGTRAEFGGFTAWYDGYTFYLLPEGAGGRRLEVDKADIHDVLPPEYYR